MGSAFLVYLRLGFEHIADPRGYDHFLFLVALTAMYPPRAWKRVLVLVTAFTLGHSLTLALATLDLIRVEVALVELVIPLTILATALLNAGEVWWGRRARAPGPPTGDTRRDGEPPRGTDRASFEPRGGRLAKYVLAAAFGLVHGLGFSNFLRAALGGEESLAVPLLAFNVGVEVGQIFIVLGIMAATGVITTRLGVSLKGWTLVLSGIAGVMALRLVAGQLSLL